MNDMDIGEQIVDFGMLFGFYPVHIAERFPLKWVRILAWLFNLSIWFPFMVFGYGIALVGLFWQIIEMI